MTSMQNWCESRQRRAAEYWSRQKLPARGGGDEGRASMKSHKAQSVAWAPKPGVGWVLFEAEMIVAWGRSSEHITSAWAKADNPGPKWGVEPSSGLWLEVSYTDGCRDARGAAAGATGDMHDSPNRRSIAPGQAVQATRDAAFPQEVYPSIVERGSPWLP